MIRGTSGPFGAHREHCQGLCLRTRGPADRAHINTKGFLSEKSSEHARPSGREDRSGIYDAAGARGASVVVPPTKTARVSRRRPRSTARDRTIKKVRAIGRRRWKKASCYHRQARVENVFFRYKSIIVSPRSDRARNLEAGDVVPGGEVWWYKFRFAGHLFRESAKTTSKALARRAERKRHLQLKEAVHGILKRAAPVTFSVAADDWMELKKPTWAAKSYEVEDRNLKHLKPAFGSLLLIDVTAEDIADYQKSRLKAGASPQDD